jgi:hypothetical protein
LICRLVAAADWVYSVAAIIFRLVVYWVVAISRLAAYWAVAIWPSPGFVNQPELALLCFVAAGQQLGYWSAALRFCAALAVRFCGLGFRLLVGAQLVLVAALLGQEPGLAHQGLGHQAEQYAALEPQKQRVAAYRLPMVWGSVCHTSHKTGLRFGWECHTQGKISCRSNPQNMLLLRNARREQSNTPRQCATCLSI